MEIQNKTNTKTYFKIRPFISQVEGDCNVNFASLYAVVNGDVTGVNGSLGIAEVNGDVTGFNGSFIGAGVGGDVKGFNGTFGYAEIRGTLKDTDLQTAFPKLSKYLPKFIKESNIPSFNTGIITTTGNTDNGVIFGFYNTIENTDGDYLAFGVINRVKKDNGKYSTRFLFDGKFTIDGIFRHKKSKLEKKLDE